jgi:hypothetical protein
MILITAALKEIFPKNTNEKVLFLGEWCKVYTERVGNFIFLCNYWRVVLTDRRITSAYMYSYRSTEFYPICNFIL